MSVISAGLRNDNRWVTNWRQRLSHDIWFHQL